MRYATWAVEAPVFLPPPDVDDDDNNDGGANTRMAITISVLIVIQSWIGMRLRSWIDTGLDSLHQVSLVPFAIVGSHYIPCQHH